jgi:hypothetical protein
MQSRVVGGVRPDRAAPGPWLDLEDLVEVERTSEEVAHPIEVALLPAGGPGWRAAEPGEQTRRLLFYEPQTPAHLAALRRGGCRAHAGVRAARVARSRGEGSLPGHRRLPAVTVHGS